MQELSAATAVEVQSKSCRPGITRCLCSNSLSTGHVTHMTAQLNETRQELELIEIRRKEAEETIADLLRLQSRYKGPTSVSIYPFVRSA